MGWFSKKEVDFRKLLNSEKNIRINGLPFTIRKINVLDHLEGAQVLSEIFSTYKTQTEKNISNYDVTGFNKARKYLTDIICAGVVKPKFIRAESSDNPNEIPIKELFNDWFLAQKLSQEIFDHTNGKKK